MTAVAPGAVRPKAPRTGGAAPSGTHVETVSDGIGAMGAMGAIAATGAVNPGGKPAAGGVGQHGADARGAGVIGAVGG